jgi:hypothetical protein
MAAQDLAKRPAPDLAARVASATCASRICQDERTTMTYFDASSVARLLDYGYSRL